MGALEILFIIILLFGTCFISYISSIRYLFCVQMLGVYLLCCHSMTAFTVFFSILSTAVDNLTNVPPPTPAVAVLCKCLKPAASPDLSRTALPELSYPDLSLAQHCLNCPNLSYTALPELS